MYEVNFITFCLHYHQNSFQLYKVFSKMMIRSKGLLGVSDMFTRCGGCSGG